MKKDKILILGAGLAGSLMAKMLSDKGFDVQVLEKRPDPRRADFIEGRSINLALSHRGIHALKKAGVYESITESLILMKGRMMHSPGGQLTFQAYGKENQGINSVSRNDLNIELINAAEKSGVHFLFGRKCIEIDLDKSTAKAETLEGNTESHTGDVLIGADGAFSALRRRMMTLDRFNYEQMYIEHGYKELSMPPVDGNFAIEPNYLHIWPRGNYMLIALPNPDRTFTCTLFFPFEGEPSFSSLNSREKVRDFFDEQFPDALEKIPDLVEQYINNPTSSLITIRCMPWHYKSNLLLGDAAHAIVPFYGQGMNAAFEDCRILIEMGEEVGFDWEKLLPDFSHKRKKDADAIAELALRNFIEMRDRVADEYFLERKKADALMHKTFGDEWLPLYSMVTFSDLPYSYARNQGYLQEEALKSAQQQDKLEDPYKVMAILNELASEKNS